MVVYFNALILKHFEFLITDIYLNNEGGELKKNVVKIENYNL